MATLDAQQKAEYRRNRFAAALKGVDLDKAAGVEDEDAVSLEEVYRRAQGDDPQKNDVADLKGEMANKDGFGIGLGLGYEEEV